MEILIFIKLGKRGLEEVSIESFTPRAEITLIYFRMFP